MSSRTGSCAFEEATAAAARREVWEPALRDHAAVCPVCSEVALVASLLRHHAETARAAAELPRAGFLWWRIELRRRRELAARATRPIALLRAALGVGLAGGVAALAWTRAGEAADWAARLQTAWAAALPDAGAMASLAASPERGLLAAAVCGLCLLLLGIYSAWAEG